MALILLGLAGIFAVRNITWFGLGTMMLLPVTVSRIARSKEPAQRRVKLNLAIALCSAALVLVASVSTFAHRAAWFESGYPQRGVSIVARLVARNPGAKIFADVHYADWLVWHDPALGGRIAYDTSFELLSDGQLAAIAGLTQEPAPGQRDTLAPYSVLVLNPANKSANRIVLARAGVHVVLRSKRVIIATKPVA